MNQGQDYDGSWRWMTLPSILTDYQVYIYQFGVFSGTSIIQIANILSQNNIISAKIFGFDSFCGNPEETREKLTNDAWILGSWSVQKQLNTPNINECIKIVYEKIKLRIPATYSVEFITGWFNELKDEIAHNNNMKPAFYIDIDCDLYCSTYDALDFMFRNKLIKTGTLIGYDDWGGSEGWQNHLSGESRAHKEMLEKYNASCVEIASHPANMKVFKII